MKTTTRAVTLLLRPESDGGVRLSLTGRVREPTMQGRARLLGLTSLWARPEPLRVALSADASGSWCWAEEWTEALTDVVGDYEVRFVTREAGHGRR